MDVVKTAKLESDSGSENPTQKENASPANAPVVNSTDNLKPIEDEKSATSQSSETNDIGASGGAHNAGRDRGYGKKLRRKTETSFRGQR